MRDILVLHLFLSLWIAFSNAQSLCVSGQSKSLLTMDSMKLVIPLHSVYLFNSHQI